MAKIMIVGGGTGGHVSPGIAVAHELLSYKHEVCWVGALRGLEKKIGRSRRHLLCKSECFLQAALSRDPYSIITLVYGEDVVR